MSLSPGARLGPYEILSPLGAGGMGEVWKAKDTRLDRFVAVKVLPEHLAKSPEALARFEREAKAVAALNHPNILGIHDFATHEATAYVVMELLEGESLRTRVQAGPLPPRVAVDLATQMAHGLAAAHDKGVIHRDLKPDNLWITKEGRIKILDFGLAKAVAGFGSGTGSLMATEALPPGSALNTREGLILGTVGYMSPEQVRGEAVDGRSDLFSFGAVLFEMLTGRRAFARSTASDTLAAILRDDPPEVETGGRPIPAGLQKILHHCLEKNPERRFHSAHDVAFALESGLSASGPLDASRLRPAPRRRGWRAAGAALAGLSVLAGAWWAGGRTANLALPGEIRFAIPTERIGDVPYNYSDADFGISPDGSRIAYVSQGPGGSAALWVRPVASLASQMLLSMETRVGSSSIVTPFWSPDGSHVAYGAQGKLWRAALSGGAPRPICDLPVGTMLAGGVWHPDGFVLFGLDFSEGPISPDRSFGIHRVPESGGEPQPVTSPDKGLRHMLHRHPVLLPDRRHFLYQVVPKDRGRAERGGIWVGDLAGQAPFHLFESQYQAGAVGREWLLYPRGSALVAQRYSLSPPGLKGEPVVVADAVTTNPVLGDAAFASTLDGTVLFRTVAEASLTQLEWFDRKGVRTGSLGQGSHDVSLSLSPDASRAVVSTATGRNGLGNIEPPLNLWVIDLSKGSRTRLTFNPDHSDENPVWSPDGKRVAFASHRGNVPSRLFVKDAMGSLEAQEIPLPDARNPHPVEWSPDGSSLLVHYIGAATPLSLYSVPLSGGRATAVVAGSSRNYQAQISKDGRWMAYVTDDSGRPEVFVRPYPAGEGRWQVSTEGGLCPRWRRDGKELYFLDRVGGLWAAAVAPGPAFQAGGPKLLFKAPMRPALAEYYGGAPNYDASPDGSRFLMLSLTQQGAAPPLNVVLNWRPPNGIRP